jgi:hypothetical protein
VLGVIYVKERIYIALNPWAIGTPGSAQQLFGDATVSGKEQFAALADEGRFAAAGAPAEAEESKEAEKYGGTMDDAKVARKMEVTAIPQIQQALQAELNAPVSQSLLNSNLDLRGLPRQSKKPKAKEKTVRPVPLRPPALPSYSVRWSFGSLLPKTPASATVLVAGPWLRGLWLFAEVIGFGALLGLVFLCSRRLWPAAALARGEEVSP